jgi:lysophospholipase L1-like esterase
MDKLVERLQMNKSSRNLVFALCCVVAFCKATAQQVKYDSVSRPEIYPLQVNLFRAAKHSKKDIVFLGNSITFWGNWNELLQTRHIKNRGIPGDVTFGVLDRLDEVIKGRPRKVFILIGINDIARNIPDSVVLQNYRRIIHAIKTGTPHTQIIFQSIFPINPSFGKLKNHYKKDHIININQGLKKIIEEEGVDFVDLFAAFVDAEGNLPANLTFDGVHLTKPGYDKWVEILKAGGYIKK